MSPPLEQPPLQRVYSTHIQTSLEIVELGKGGGELWYVGSLDVSLGKE